MQVFLMYDSTSCSLVHPQQRRSCWIRNNMVVLCQASLMQGFGLKLSTALSALSSAHHHLHHHLHRHLHLHLPPVHHQVRHLVPPGTAPQQPVSRQQLGAEGEQLVWDAFHDALSPVVQAGRMGCVVFQFQLSFTATPQVSAQKTFRALERPGALSMRFVPGCWS